MRKIIVDGTVILLLVCALTPPTVSHAQAVRDLWVEKTTKATERCHALYRRSVQHVKRRDFADCMGDQVERATNACIGIARDRFASCVMEQSLRVMETCDLSEC
jgi:hypothetical protein